MLLLLLRTVPTFVSMHMFWHHARHSLPPHTKVGIDIINYATKQNKSKIFFCDQIKFNEPVLQSGNQNRSIFLTTKCYLQIPAEKVAVICQTLYRIRNTNMYLQMVQCAHQTSRRYASVLLTMEVTGKNVMGRVKVFRKKF